MNELILRNTGLMPMSNYLDRQFKWLDDFFTTSVVNFHKEFKSWLPYNFSVNRKDNTAKFSIALAGFSASDLDVSYSDGMLTIKNKPADKEDEQVEYVHRGLATRLFEFAMPVNPLYEITEATFKNGLLTILFKKLESTSKKVEIKTE